MRPVDNFFGSAVGAFVDQRCRVSSREGVCSGVAIHPVGDLLAIAGTTSNAGERGHGTVFGAGVRGSSPHTLPGAVLQWSGRGSRIGLVEGPAADHGDRHMSPSLCFVVFVRLKNLAQNHFRNVSARCAVTPAGACSRHPRRGHDLTFGEQFFTIACVVCMRCMHSVFSTHTQQAAHPVLEQSRIGGVCRGCGRRWNSGARFTLPLRGHSPGPSGLGGVYCSKLLRTNIFQSAAGQGSVRVSPDHRGVAPAAVSSTPFSAVRTPGSVPHEARRSRA